MTCSVRELKCWSGSLKPNTKTLYLRLSLPSELSFPSGVTRRVRAPRNYLTVTQAEPTWILHTLSHSPSRPRSVHSLLSDLYETTFIRKTWKQVHGVLEIWINYWKKWRRQTVATTVTLSGRVWTIVVKGKTVVFTKTREAATTLATYPTLKPHRRSKFSPTRDIQLLSTTTSPELPTSCPRSRMRTTTRVSRCQNEAVGDSLSWTNSATFNVDWSVCKIPNKLDHG